MIGFSELRIAIIKTTTVIRIAILKGDGRIFLNQLA
jgi:hypothetical protein